MTSSTLAERPAQRSQVARRVKNTRLYVARVDFAAIRCGEKRLWREYKLFAPNRLMAPVIIASHHPTADRIDTALSFLLDSWIDLLGSISDEEIAEEGFDSRREFKRYFAERYPNVGYRPLQKVRVYRVRPLTDEDREEWQEQAWNECYGSFA